MSVACEKEVQQVSIAGRTLEVLRFNVSAPNGTVVLLHEALGSATYWKDFPERLAKLSQWNIIAYSRAGFGWSEGPLEARDKAHFTHQTHEVLPALLAHFGLQRPVLYGHSEGAGLALMFAAERPTDVQALVLESPMIVPGAQAGAAISHMAATYEGSRLQKLLAQYHREPDIVFHSWTAWSKGFNPASAHVLRDMLPAITCPVFAIIGANDPLGADAQLEHLQAGVANLQYDVLPGVGHLPHRENAELTLSLTAKFLSELQA